MRAVILGGGVIGLTTAYVLAQDGYSVSVIDKNTNVGAGASKENGAQLSYSYAAPLADPSVLAKLPHFLVNRESPTRFGRWADADLVTWMIRFFANCSDAAFSRNVKKLLQYSYFSRYVFDKKFADIEGFDFKVAGKLVVFTNRNELEQAKSASLKSEFALAEKKILSSSECYGIEPALSRYPRDIVGGVYSPTDAVGDCQKFCQRLAEATVGLARGNEIILGTEIKELRLCGDRVDSAVTTAGDVDGDLFILCLGVGARSLAKALSFDVPIYPLKGYSITAPVLASRAALRTSITDFSKKIVVANVGSRLRVAGLLDFDGYDTSIRDNRLGLLKQQARELWGDFGDFDSARGWAGLRPATPDGLPIIGRSPIDNLYLNVGHGGLGFTLAAGSAQILADQISGRPPEFELGHWQSRKSQQQYSRS